MRDIYPFLAVKDVDAAVEFYAKAFDAREAGERVRAPDGPQVALLSIGGHRVGVATEAPASERQVPRPSAGRRFESRSTSTIPIPLPPERSPPVRRRCFRSPISGTGCVKVGWWTPSATTG
jgi:catechol 2,3-dioxygenase-like lactoylglutathione lyase family enzyme